MTRLLVISNGHGEDQIACQVIQAFTRHNPATEVIGFPLVGAGHAYTQRGISTLKKPNPTFPSGGFIRNIPTLIKDLRAGLLSHIFRQKRHLLKRGRTADIIICVGDIFCLWMGSSAQNQVYFLPTAKSDLFMPHSRIELALMRNRAKKIFTRDLPTAITLQSARLPALFLGNPMMDGITLKNISFGFSGLEPVLVLLPGSRDEAYANLEAMLTVVKKMAISLPFLQILVVKAPSLDTKKIQNLCAIAMLRHLTITDAFWDALKAAHLVLGLSGTANEQAVYVGKTVYCFEGSGPQSTKQRFEEQKKLLGESLTFISEKDPTLIAHELLEALKQCPKTPVFNVPDTQASELIYRSIMTKD